MAVRVDRHWGAETGRLLQSFYARSLPSKADVARWSQHGFMMRATQVSCAMLLSSSDVEMLMGCGVENLARLIGRTQATIDGVTVDMTLRLMVVGTDQMYGIFHTSAVVKGIPVKSWRAVTLTR